MHCARCVRDSTVTPFFLFAGDAEVRDVGDTELLSASQTNVWSRLHSLAIARIPVSVMRVLCETSSVLRWGKDEMWSEKKESERLR